MNCFEEDNNIVATMKTTHELNFVTPFTRLKLVEVPSSLQTRRAKLAYTLLSQPIKISGIHL